MDESCFLSAFVLGVPKESTSTSGAKANRFGFKTAYSVRPASTGITPKVTDFSEVNDNMENNNNNNCGEFGVLDISLRICEWDVLGVVLMEKSSVVIIDL